MRLVAVQQQRSHTVTRVVMFGILVAALVVASTAVSTSASPANELHVPPGFHSVLNQALRTSPRLAELELTLALAESVHRQNQADRYGMQSGLVTPLLLSEDGATSGIEFRLNQGLGNARFEGSLGLGARYDWDGSDGLRAAPAGRMALHYPLGQGPDVGGAQLDLTLAEAYWKYTQGIQAWERSLLSAYDAWLAALRDVEAAKQRVALEEERLNAVQVRVEDGGTAAMAVHEAAQQLVAAQDRYEEAQFEAENKLRALQRLVGPDYDLPTTVALALAAGEPPLRIQYESTGAAPETLQDWIQLAYQYRGETLIAQARLDLAKQELARARAQAGISGELVSDVVYRPKTSGEWELTWQAGAVWQLPLHDTTRSEAVVQAELNVAKAEAALQAATEQVEDAVWEAFRKVDLAMRRVQRLEDQVAHADFLLELAQNRLNAGLTARETVLEAEWVLTSAANALADAEGELSLAILSLWHAAGKDVTW